MRLQCALSVLVCVSSVAAFMEQVCFQVNQYSPFLNQTFQFQPQRAVDLVLFRPTYTPYNHTADSSELLYEGESVGTFHKQERDVFVNKSLNALETFSFAINTTGEICAHLYHDNNTVGDATDSVMPAISFINSLGRFDFDEQKRLTHMLKLASIVLLCLTLGSFYQTFNSASGVSLIYQDLICLVLIKLISALFDAILYLIGGNSGLGSSLLYISSFLLRMLWHAGLYKLSTGVFGVNATSLRGVLKMPILLKLCFIIITLRGCVIGLKRFVKIEIISLSAVLVVLSLAFTKIIIFVNFKITAKSTKNLSISHNLLLSRMLVIVLPLVIIGVFDLLCGLIKVINTKSWNGTLQPITYSKRFDWRSLIYIHGKDITMFVELWALAYIWRPRSLNGNDQEMAIELSGMD